MKKPSLNQYIAIIGGGTTGVAAALRLTPYAHVTLFEQREHLGGNIDTHWVTDSIGQEIPIDTGFISFNTPYYPEFLQFLKTLNIETGHSQMSYGIDNQARGYNSSGRSFIEAMVKTKPKASFCYWRLRYEGKKFERIARQEVTAFTADLTLEKFAEK